MGGLHQACKSAGQRSRGPLLSFNISRLVVYLTRALMLRDSTCDQGPATSPSAALPGAAGGRGSHRSGRACQPHRLAAGRPRLPGATSLKCSHSSRPPSLPSAKVLTQTSPRPKEFHYLLEATFLPAESQTSVALQEPNNWIYVSKDTIKTWVKWLLNVHTEHLMKVISCECQSTMCQEKQRASPLWKEVLTVTGISALITMETFVY